MVGRLLMSHVNACLGSVKTSTMGLDIGVAYFGGYPHAGDMYAFPMVFRGLHLPEQHLKQKKTNNDFRYDTLL